MSLNCYFNLIFLICVYMTSFSYHKNARKIPNIIFGETFHSSWQDDLSFLSGGGGGGGGQGREGTLPRVSAPYPFIQHFPAEKLPFSYTFH